MNDLLKQIAGAITTICFTLYSLPQIYKIWKSKSSKNISYEMLTLGLVGYIFGLYYVISSNSGGFLIFNYIFGVITSAILYFLWYIYRKNN